jgi:hypothetical protein
MEEIKMKKLNVTATCMAVYNSSIEVPDEMNLEEAIEYAKEHINEIPLGEMEYISDSDELDEENCDFDEMIVKRNDCKTWHRGEADSPDQAIIDQLYAVIEEFDARESSGNCLSLYAFNWDELCDKGIRLFEQLKQPIKE